jgi:multiple sugar transport system ATP-binding protein
MLGSLGIAVPSSASSSVTVGIRPEGVAPATTGFEVAVEVVEELGADAFVYGKPVDKSLKFANTSEELGQVIIRWDPKSPPKPGQTVTVGVNSNIVHLFDAATGKRLN